MDFVIRVAGPIGWSGVKIRVKEDLDIQENWGVKYLSLEEYLAYTRRVEGLDGTGYSQTKMRQVFDLYNIKMRLGLWLVGSDVFALALASKGWSATCRPMLQAMWKWCPRITEVTGGALSEDLVFASYMSMTQMGRIIPVSQGMWADLQKSRRDLMGLRQHTKHSVFWVNDHAFGVVIRWLEVVYSGYVEDDADVFDQLAVCEMLMADDMVVRVPHVVANMPDWVDENTTIQSCVDVHDAAYMNRCRREAALWGFDRSQAYIEGSVNLLKRNHSVVSCVNIGETKTIRQYGEGHGVPIEQYKAVLHLRNHCNKLDKKVMEMLALAYSE